MRSRHVTRRRHLVHEGWKDNLFLQTAFDKGMADIASTAPVVVRREYRTARQVMNPLEGKAVLAQWEERTGQLVVIPRPRCRT